MNKHLYLLALLCIGIGGCSNIPNDSTSNTAAPTFTPQSQRTATTTYNSEQGALFADLLLAEMALQSRDNAEAYRRYRKIAQQTNSSQAYAVTYALALREQDHDQAYTLAQAWVKTDENNLRAHKALALSALQQGDISVLLATLTHLEKKEGKPLDAQFIDLYRQYNLHPDQKVIRDILNRQPHSPRQQLWALFLSGYIIHEQLENGELKQAQDAIKGVFVYKTHPQPTLTPLIEYHTESILMHKMRLQILTDRLAIDAFVKQVNQKKHYHRLRYLLAEQYSLMLNAGDEKKAHLLLRTLLKQDAGTPIRIYKQAMRLAAQLQMPLRFDQLAERLPHSNKEERAERAYVYATALMNRYQYNLALPIFTRLFDQGHKSSTLPDIIDILYKQQNEEQLQKALALIDTKLLEGALLKANLLQKIGNSQASYDVLAQWLANADQQTTTKQKDALLHVYILQASNQYFLGKIPAMARDIDARLATHPEEDILLNSFGFMLTEADTQLVRAHGLIEKALSFQPSNPAYIDSLGWAEYKLGRYQSAAKTLAISYRLLPNDETGAHLADAYSKLKQHARAKRLYRRIWLTNRFSRFLPKRLLEEFNRRKK